MSIFKIVKTIEFNPEDLKTFFPVVVTDLSMKMVVGLVKASSYHHPSYHHLERKTSYPCGVNISFNPTLYHVEFVRGERKVLLEEYSGWKVTDLDFVTLCGLQAFLFGKARNMAESLAVFNFDPFSAIVVFKPEIGLFVVFNENEE